jgi:hypothetical protein
MLGWHVSVYRLVPRDQPAAPAATGQLTTHRLTLEAMDSLRGQFTAGDRLAVWQSGAGGLRWVDELVGSGAAIASGTNGYPSVFYAQAADVLGRLDSPPGASETWISGPGDILGEKWAGRTVTDPVAIAACAPGEWLLIEAWDES